MEITRLGKLLRFFHIVGRPVKAAPNIDRPPLNVRGARIVQKGKTTKRYRCGHEGPVEYEADVYGQTLESEPRVTAAGERCPKCLLEQFLAGTIRCVRCGLAITPLNPVVLYVASGSDPDYTILANGHAIGCARPDCLTPKRRRYDGYWVNGKFVASLSKEVLEVFRRDGPIVAVPLRDDGSSNRRFPG